MRRFGLWLVLAFLTFFQPVVSAAQSGRTAVLLVCDTGDDAQMANYLKMVKSLKELRASGQLDKIAGLDRAFKLYDFNLKSHQAAIARLHLSRKEQSPYLAIVTLDGNNVPAKIVWGQKISAPEQSILDLRTYLKLEKPVAKVLPKLPAKGWAKSGEMWLHAYGLTLVAPSHWSVEESNGGINVRDGETRMYLSILPLPNIRERDESIQIVRDDIRTIHPALKFSDTEYTKGDGLEYSWEAGENVDGVLGIGSVTVQGRAIVYYVTIPKSELTKDGVARLKAFLGTTRFIEPGKSTTNPTNPSGKS